MCKGRGRYPRPLLFISPLFEYGPTNEVRLRITQFSCGSWCAKALLLAREDAPCFEHPFLAGARKLQMVLKGVARA